MFITIVLYFNLISCMALAFIRKIALFLSLTIVIFTGKHLCPNCSRIYIHKTSLMKHLKFECGVIPKFYCTLCKKYFKQPHNFRLHMANKHKILTDRTE